MKKLLGIALHLIFFGAAAAISFGAEPIPWTNSFEEALSRAAKENKPIMIDFMAEWCPPCKAMDGSTFKKPSIIEKAKSFIPVRIDVDKQKSIAQKYNALALAHGGIGIPNMLFLSPQGKKITHIVGFHTAPQLLIEMNKALKSVQR